MISFARWMVRHPILCLAANLAITVVLGYFALGIRIESSLSSVLPAGDPQIAYYAKVRETFGSDDVAVVGVRADNIFAPSTIEKIARVTDTIAKVKGVQSVLSITNAPDLAEDVINQPRLLPHIPPSAAEVETLKKKLTAIPLYGKNLVADDFKGAAINVFLQEPDRRPVRRSRRRPQDPRDPRAEHGPEHFYFTGAAHLTQSAVELMRRDLVRFTPIALALVLVVFWLSFWSVRGVVLPAVSVLMALSWTLGVMVLVRQGDHARHVRAAAAAAGDRQLLRDPRDGALLRAGRRRRAARRSRGARLRARLAAAADLGVHHRHRLRLADGEPHHRDLGPRPLRGGRRRVPDGHLAHASFPRRCSCSPVERRTQTLRARSRRGCQTR